MCLILIVGTVFMIVAAIQFNASLGTALFVLPFYLLPIAGVASVAVWLTASLRRRGWRGLPTAPLLTALAVIVVTFVVVVMLLLAFAWI